MCVRIAWLFPCELSFGVSNQLINALINIFGKALFGMFDALISRFGTDVIGMSRLDLMESMNTETMLCFEVEVFLGGYAFRNQLHFVNGNMWGGKC